jgi:hypothetical protein
VSLVLIENHHAGGGLINPVSGFDAADFAGFKKFAVLLCRRHLSSPLFPLVCLFAGWRIGSKISGFSQSSNINALRYPNIRPNAKLSSINRAKPKHTPIYHMHAISNMSETANTLSWLNYKNSFPNCPS